MIFTTFGFLTATLGIQEHLAINNYYLKGFRTSSKWLISNWELEQSMWYDRDTSLNIQVRQLSQDDWSLITSHFLGSYKPRDETLLLHEPSGGRDLALRPRCLRTRFYYHVHRGEVLPLRVAESPSMRHGERPRRESVLNGQLVLVHHWHTYAARVRPQSQGNETQREYVQYKVPSVGEEHLKRPDYVPSLQDLIFNRLFISPWVIKTFILFTIIKDLRILLIIIKDLRILFSFIKDLSKRVRLYQLFTKKQFWTSEVNCSMSIWCCFTKVRS